MRNMLASLLASCILLVSVTLVPVSQPVFCENASEQKSMETSAGPSKIAGKTEPSIQPATKPKGANPMVVLNTNYGDITLELFAKEAPISVEAFLRYVREGFYDNTIFHRVVKGFVIQAGGMTQDLEQKKQHDPIKNEATNGLSNQRGTVSMARTQAINSATSHFFINLVDNTRLDHKGEDPASYGYAVFGKVVKGMDVVDKIAEVKVTTKKDMQNVPAEPVIIKKAYVLEKDPVEQPSKNQEEKEGKGLKKEAKQITDE